MGQCRSFFRDNVSYADYLQTIKLIDIINLTLKGLYRGDFAVF